MNKFVFLRAVPAKMDEFVFLRAVPGIYLRYIINPGMRTVPGVKTFF